MPPSDAVSYYQSYPPPTPLPGMRVTSIDGRYMDCSTALGPVGDRFIDAASVTVTISRQDCKSIGPSDLQLYPQWAASLDSTGMIYTAGYYAPPGTENTNYLLTIQAQTQAGRLFVRDWTMAVVSLMG